MKRRSFLGGALTSLAGLVIIPKLLLPSVAKTPATKAIDYVLNEEWKIQLIEWFPPTIRAWTAIPFNGKHYDYDRHAHFVRIHSIPGESNRDRAKEESFTLKALTDMLSKYEKDHIPRAYDVCGNLVEIRDIPLHISSRILHS